MQQHPSAQTPASPQFLHRCCSLHPPSLALGVDRGNFNLNPPCNGHHCCTRPVPPGEQLPALCKARATCATAHDGSELEELNCPPLLCQRQKTEIEFVWCLSRVECCHAALVGMENASSFSTETKKIPHLCQICNTAWGRMGNKFSSFFFCYQKKPRFLAKNRAELHPERSGDVSRHRSRSPNRSMPSHPAACAETPSGARQRELGKEPRCPARGPGAAAKRLFSLTTCSATSMHVQDFSPQSAAHHMGANNCFLRR